MMHLTPAPSRFPARPHASGSRTTRLFATVPALLAGLPGLLIGLLGMGLLALQILGLGLLAAPALAQPVADNLSEEERVTAIDVLLSFERSDAAEWARERRSPRGLAADDFTVRVGGDEQAVVSVQALEDAAPGGWSQLVYVDCRMASPAHLTWTLAALSAQADALVARGTVEVVVADPTPQTLLAASDDAELVRAVLGRLATREECSDLLTLLRDEALTTINASDGVARSEAARRALEAERNLVRSSRLALATRLTDGLRREGGAQKALFLVHEGPDAAPDEFYAPYVDGPLTEPKELLTSGDLARIVSSYGWTVVALETRRDQERPGVFIGDWFFYPDHGGDNPEKTQMDEHFDLGTSTAGGRTMDDGDPWQSFLGGIRGKLKENKDVGKAESYLELGNALFAQGKYERAADSFEKALYHFADAAKTRDQQTMAMVQLGNALAAAGQRERARQAIEAAIDQNPDLAEQSGAESVDLGDRGHADLIDATAGVVARGVEDLEDALAAVGGKTRLTFQIVGEPRGEALPLEVDYGGDTPLRHPAWTRSSTPEEVATARLLRLVDDELRGGTFDDGEIDLAAARREDGSVDLRAALAAAGLEDPQLRVSSAPGTAEGGLHSVHHRALDASDAAAFSEALDVPEGADFVAVLVEDLETGAWGAALFGG